MKTICLTYLRTYIIYLIINCNTAVIAVTDDDVKNFAAYVEEELRKVQEAELPVDFSEFRVDEDFVPYDYGTYDFIIVGAGATGTILANRLSENTKWKILLLEAGDYPNNFTMIPGMINQMRFTEYNWGFKTVPQNFSCLGNANRQCIIPRGRGVGGTTLINGLLYVRGHPIDFDKWAGMGNPGWSYKEVLPIFKKTEGLVKNNEQAKVNWRYHNKRGPLHVEFYPTSDALLNAYYDAHKELGYKFVDVNSPHQIGITPKLANIKNGRRFDDGTAFILPIKTRDNLHVVTKAFVTKININDCKRATGVTFSLNGLKYIARTSKEVILSAGSINTPQLLMLSGVGPKEHLQAKNIGVIENLPVGKTLYEHPMYYGMVFSTNYTEPVKTFEENIRDYLHGTGMFTIPGTLKSLSFYKSSVEPLRGYPDLEIMYSAGNCTGTFMKKAFAYTDDTYEATFTHVNPAKCFILYPIVLHAKSTGYVRLQDGDPYKFPLIDPNHLGDPENHDIDTLYEGIKLILKLVGSKALKKIDARLAVKPLAACAQHKFMSKDYWYCSLGQLTGNVYHPVGSCPMGPRSDGRSVVDSELKVHGIERLRVADASVFPLTLSGHPSAPCTMIGEKLAGVLKKLYSCR